MMSFSAKQFVKALDRVKRCIPNKTTYPWQSCITLEFRPGELTMIALDYDTRLTVSVPCPDYRPAGGELISSIAVNAKALSTLAKDAKNEIDFEIVEIQNEEIATKDTVKSLVVTIDRDPITLKSIPAEDFPSPWLAEMAHGACWQNTHTADLASFDAALDYAMLAMSDDYTRQHINAIHIDGRNMVATDGHRMHVAKFEKLFSGEKVPVTITATMAHWLHNAMPKQGETIDVFTFEKVETYEILNDPSRKEGQIRTPFVKITGPDFTLTGKACEGEFPPYEQVIPGHSQPGRCATGFEADHEITLDKAQARKVFERARKLATDRIAGVKLSLNYENSKIDVSTNSVEFGSTKQTLAFSYPDKARDESWTGGMVIGFNVALVLDSLNFDGSKVTMKMGKVLDPITVQDEEKTRLAVVMPMRI